MLCLVNFQPFPFVLPPKFLNLALRLHFLPLLVVELQIRHLSTLNFALLLLLLLLQRNFCCFLLFFAFDAQATHTLVFEAVAAGFEEEDNQTDD
jgi:hypothetical protein